MRSSNPCVESNTNTPSIYFMDSNTSFLSCKLLKGLSSPLSFFTFSSESIPMYNLDPKLFAYLNNYPLHILVSYF